MDLVKARSEHARDHAVAGADVSDAACICKRAAIAVRTRLPSMEAGSCLRGRTESTARFTCIRSIRAAERGRRFPRATLSRVPGVGLCTRLLCIRRISSCTSRSALRSFVNVWSLNQNSGLISPSSGSPFGTGALTSSVSVRVSDGRFLFVPQYETGHVSAYTVNADGTLTAVAGSPVTAGNAPSRVASGRSAGSILLRIE